MTMVNTEHNETLTAQDTPGKLTTKIQDTPAKPYTKRQRLSVAVDANQRMVELCQDKMKEKQRYNDAKLALLLEKNKILERLAVAAEKFITS